MVSTPTTRLRFERQGLGDGLNVWGETKLNDALERIDEAIGGIAAITISGTSTTLTSTNYATDQARKAALVLTGTLGANSTVTVPNVEKLYLVVNNTTQGAYSLTIKTAAGSGCALRPGPQWVYCDATDVYRATPRLDQLPVAASDVALGSQRITGLGAPSADTDAATKKYVDDAGFSLASGALPGQSGNSGKYLTTDGSTASWGTPASAVTSVNGSTGAVSITAAGLGAAPLASPTFTGVPAAPTASAGTTTTQVATTAFVTAADNLKADLASPTFTGTPAAPTASAGTNTTQVATTAFVTGGYAALATVNTFTKAQRGSIVALTDATTIAVDASLGNYFSVTLGGNRTLGNPSNLVAGQGGSIIITQDGTGSRTLAYSSNWKFAGGTAPVLTTTAAAVDRLDYLVVSSSVIHATLTKDVR